MALTDHDTIDGIPEAVSCAADYDIELIPGIELSTFYDKKEIHIVGLYIDYTDKNFKKELESLKQSREKRNEKIAARFCEMGIPVSYDEMKKMYEGAVITRAKFCRLPCKKRLCKKPQ